MGTLAFDADRLRLLGTALTDTSERLAAVRCDDPEGNAALATAGAARAVFDRWAICAAEIASCGALGDYRPVIVDPGVLFLALDHVLAAGYGWTTTTDPLGDEWHVPAVQQAAALATVLSHHGATLGTSSDEFLLLVQLLDVVADPAALGAFRANLSLAGAAALADALARQRGRLVADGGGPPGSGLDADVELVARVSRIDEIAAALATVLVDPSGSLADARAALARMRPYTAAMIVAQLDGGVDDEWVVALAESAMRRYFDLRDDPQHQPMPGELADGRSLGIGDLLFPRIAACTPLLANRFVRTVGAMSQELLTHTVHDPANAAAVLATATDPRVGSAAAGQVLVPLIEQLRDPGPSPEVPASVTHLDEAVSGLRPHLGALLAPWMVQFLDDQPAFGWSEPQRREVMRFVLADDQALADLLALSGRWADSLPIAGPVTDPERLHAELDRVAGVMGELRGLLESRLGANALSAQAQWDLMVSLLPKLAGKGIKYTGISGTPAKIVVKAVNKGIAAGSDLAQDHGWLGAPPPLGEVLHGVAVDSDLVMATGSYLATSTMRALLIERGELPADLPDVPPPWDGSGCPSKDYRAVLDEWLRGVDDPLAFHRLDNASHAFTATGSAALECERLVD